MAGKSFRKGIGIIELLEMFPDDDAAQEWFESIRWPDGRTCSKCNSERTREVPNAKPMPYWCSDCRQYFSVKLGTVMESSNLPLRKWAIAFYQILTNLKGVSSMKLHRDLGIAQSSAWHGPSHRWSRCFPARWKPTRLTSAASESAGRGTSAASGRGPGRRARLMPKERRQTARRSGLSSTRHGADSLVFTDEAPCIFASTATRSRRPQRQYVRDMATPTVWSQPATSGFTIVVKHLTASPSSATTTARRTSDQMADSRLHRQTAPVR